MIKQAIKSAIKKYSPLVNVPYEAQLQIKEVRAWNVLKYLHSEIRKTETVSIIPEYTGIKMNLPCEVEPILSSSIINGYLNKTIVSVGFDKNKKFIVGCSLELETINSTRFIFRELPNKLHKKNHLSIIQLFEQYLGEYSSNFSTKRNCWRYLIIKSNNDNKSLVQIGYNKFSSNPDTLSKTRQNLVEKFIPMLKNENIDVQSLYFQLKHSGNSESTYNLLWGERYITESLCNRIFHIGPWTNFPVNTHMIPLLYDTIKRLVTESLAVSPKNILIIDLCCGSGSLGITLSDFANKIIGIDARSTAIADANLNSTANNITNVEYIHQDAEDFVSSFAKSPSTNSYNAIIAVINPNKFGLSTNCYNQLRHIPNLKMILFVTNRVENNLIINLSTLCKTTDCSNEGDPFKLVKAIPLDASPHTTNVQLIMQFVR